MTAERASIVTARMAWAGLILWILTIWYFV